MPDDRSAQVKANPALSRHLLALDDEHVPVAERLAAARTDLRVQPDLLRTLRAEQPLTPPIATGTPGPVAQPAPEPEPLTAPPAAPAADPFTELPYPSPGERIRAEDFRRLSQSLRVIADAYALAGAVFGHPLGQVRPALRAQGYEIARVLSVSGTELAGPDDPALDERKVVHVAPLGLGEGRLGVVVTEVPAVRQRQMPNLVGLTYRQAAERLQEQLGDVLAGSPPMTVSNLVGQTLSDAHRALGG